jgi:hypothetical protein
VLFDEVVCTDNVPTYPFYRHEAPLTCFQHVSSVQYTLKKQTCSYQDIHTGVSLLSDLKRRVPAYGDVRRIG